MATSPSTKPGGSDDYASGGSSGRSSGGASGDWRASFREAGPYLGLGMQIAASLGFFVAVGYFADKWLGTTPWMIILGAVVGMTAVMIHLVRVSKQMAADFNDGDSLRRPPIGSDDPPRAK